MGNCQKQQDQGDTVLNGSGPVNQIRISNFVWNKDYQGLFDYDTKSIQKKSLKIKGDAIIIKHGSKFELADDNVTDLNQTQLKNALFKIQAKPNFYQILPIYIEGETYTLQKILWVVVNSLPNKGHNIQQRDILKLGKQKIRIREIVHADNNSSMIGGTVKLSKNVYEDLTFKQPNLPKSQLMIENDIRQTHSEITNSEQVCRICLDPGEYDNPLITPCKCSGSVKYIHINCLKSWLGKRLNAVKSQYCITINWLPLSCQMCKAPFRYRIYMDNKKFYTVDIPKPAKPYIIIQLMRKQSSTKGKVFHFVSFAEKKKINLGRRKDIDVKISQDISISRAHATIQYVEESKKFIITDNKSKFGTLVLVKKGIIATPQYPGISIQIGAEVFSFDALRGEKNQKFEPAQNAPDQYLMEDSGDEQENQNTQESEGESQQENPGGEGEEEAASPSAPQLRNRSSVVSQPN